MIKDYVIFYSAIIFLFLVFWYFLRLDAKNKNLENNISKTKFSIIIGLILILVATFILPFNDTQTFVQRNNWWDEGYVAHYSVYINISFFIRAILGILLLLSGINLIASKKIKVEKDE